MSLDLATSARRPASREHGSDLGADRSAYPLRPFCARRAQNDHLVAAYVGKGDGVQRQAGNGEGAHLHLWKSSATRVSIKNWNLRERSHQECQQTVLASYLGGHDRRKGATCKFLHRVEGLKHLFRVGQALLGNQWRTHEPDLGNKVVIGEGVR